MTSIYRRIDDAIAQSDNVFRGPWKRRAPIKNPIVRTRDLPADVPRIPEDRGEPLPVIAAQYMLPAAIFCALMDVGCEHPEIRAVYEGALERMRKLVHHEDERVRDVAQSAWLAAISRAYV